MIPVQVTVYLPEFDQMYCNDETYLCNYLRNGNCILFNEPLKESMIHRPDNPDWPLSRMNRCRKCIEACNG